MDTNPKIIRFYEFDEFQVDVSERRLTQRGEIVPLTPKVFDTLLLLLKRNGQTVDKQELMRQLWPDTFVEESSLAQNIFQIRRALGEKQSEARYIETIPKRGYRFCADVREFPAIPAEELMPQRSSVTSAFPFRKFSWRRVAVPAVVIILIGAVGVTVLLQRSRSDNPKGFPEIKTLAVLPFRPLDKASEDEPMRFGMADALISRLSNLGHISVRPTSTTLNFAASSNNAVEAGRQLRVDAVLDGTIQRVNNHLRINVQLVRVNDGGAIWSETFDEQFTNILALEDSISEQVVAKLAGKLSSGAASYASNRYTKNAEAYQEYVRGRYFWNKRTEDGFRKGIEHYKRAIEIDPAYGLAYAGLADCYMFLAASQSGDAVERARAAAKKALELDPTLAEAHTTLGMISSDHDGNAQEGEKAYLRAIEFNPNYATAHHWYGLDLFAAGQFDKALVEVKKAQELDPLSLQTNMVLGLFHFYMRRYDDAIKQLQQTLELDVDHAGSRVCLGLAYEQKRMRREALDEFEKVLKRYANNVGALSARAHIQATMGKREEAEKVLDDLVKRPNPRPFIIHEIALINAALGNKDEALRWIEKLSHSKAKGVVIRLKYDPRLDVLRSDPRFKVPA